MFKINKHIHPNKNDLDKYLYKVFLSKNHGFYKIVGIFGKKDTHKVYIIKFLKTKSYNIITSNKIKDGLIKDLYNPSLCNVGYIGYFKYIYNKDASKERLYKVWCHMIQRCYDKSCKNYKYYGSKGVRVSKRWHSFTNFYKDVQKIEGWNEELLTKSIKHLDKDLNSNKIKEYNRNTCIWRDPLENVIDNKRTIKVKCVTTGETFKSIRSACIFYDFNRFDFTKALKTNGCFGIKNKTKLKWEVL